MSSSNLSEQQRQPQSWRLYGTLGCHLCDQAEQLVRQLQAQFIIELKKVDIADDPALVEALGESIPVLENLLTQEQIFWPFDPEQLTGWLLDETGPCSNES